MTRPPEPRLYNERTMRCACCDADAETAGLLELFNTIDGHVWLCVNERACNARCRGRLALPNDNHITATVDRWATEWLGAGDEARATLIGWLRS